MSLGKFVMMSAAFTIMLSLTGASQVQAAVSVSVTPTGTVTPGQNGGSATVSVSGAPADTTIEIEFTIKNTRNGRIPLPTVIFVRTDASGNWTGTISGNVPSGSPGDNANMTAIVTVEETAYKGSGSTTYQ